MLDAVNLQNEKLSEKKKKEEEEEMGLTGLPVLRAAVASDIVPSRVRRGKGVQG
jgi:hypothetical protein